MSEKLSGMCVRQETEGENGHQKTDRAFRGRTGKKSPGGKREAQGV